MTFVLYPDLVSKVNYNAVIISNSRTLVLLYTTDVNLQFFA